VLARPRRRDMVLLAGATLAERGGEVVIRLGWGGLCACRVGSTRARLP